MEENNDLGKRVKGEPGIRKEKRDGASQQPRKEDFEGKTDVGAKTWKKTITY